MIGRIKKTYPTPSLRRARGELGKCSGFECADEKSIPLAPEFAVESEAPIGEYMAREWKMRALLLKMDNDDLGMREEYEQYKRIEGRIRSHVDDGPWMEFEALRIWKAKQVIIEIHYNVLYSLACGGMLGNSCQ